VAMKLLWFSIVLFQLTFIVSCDMDANKVADEIVDKTTSVQDSLISTDDSEVDFLDEIDTSAIELQLIKAGLVNIQDIDSSLIVDVLYATDNNFMNRVIYPEYDKVYLQPEIAKRLSIAQQKLKAIDSTLSLVVLDGARPLSVQQEMWDAMDTIPFNERVNFLSNPANGSVHNYGCAVDLSIIDLKTGYWLDMGAGYDDLRKIAYPRHEEEFLASGELTKEQVDNRKLLRKVMKAGGFWVIETEWWHFNGLSREKAKEKYEIIE